MGRSKYTAEQKTNIVRLAQKLRKDGVTWSDVAIYLNDKLGTKWNADSMAEFVKNNKKLTTSQGTNEIVAKWKPGKRKGGEWKVGPATPSQLKEIEKMKSQTPTAVFTADADLKKSDYTEDQKLKDLVDLSGALATVESQIADAVEKKKLLINNLRRIAKSL